MKSRQAKNSSSQHEKEVFNLDVHDKALINNLRRNKLVKQLSAYFKRPSILIKQLK